jgi:NUMOD4 motif/HNH endonuclease
MEDERWRDVVTHPGLYEVSDLGRVRSLDRGGRKGRLLSTRVDHRGYRKATLSLDGRQEYVKVAKLVAMACCGPRPSLEHEVCHGNGVSDDDRALNLRWCTRSENMEDARRHGTLRIGERVHSAKLQPVHVTAIRHDTRIAREIARDYGVGVSQVLKIRRCEKWRHLTPCPELAAVA